MIFLYLYFKLSAKGYEPLISNLQTLSLQHTQWPKNNFIDWCEILVQKAYYTWHAHLQGLQISYLWPDPCLHIGQLSH